MSWGIRTPTPPSLSLLNRWVIRTIEMGLTHFRVWIIIYEPNHTWFSHYPKGAHRGLNSSNIFHIVFNPPLLVSAKKKAKKGSRLKRKEDWWLVESVIKSWTPF